MHATPLSPGVLGSNSLQYSTIEASQVQSPTRTGGNDWEDELTSLILSVRQAATNPAALEQLAMLLLEQEPVRAGPYLGPLLRPAPGAAVSIPETSWPRPPYAATTEPSEPSRNSRACSLEDLEKSATQLEDPEKLWRLVDNFVPYKHLEYFVSLAGSVDWPVLAQEMDDVAEQYLALKPHQSPSTRSASLYIAANRNLGDKEMNEAQVGRLNRSKRKLAPYALLGHMRIQGRLDGWTVSSASDGTEARLLFQPRPTQTLFDHWTAKAVPIEQQAWMARFVAQGFAEATAWALSKTYEQAPARLQAWFAHGHDADLGPRLDKAMKDRVAHWLADTTLSSDTLALLPAMIQSDLSVDQINNIVRMGRVPHHVKAMFGPHSNATAKVWYGMVTPDQVYRHAMAIDDAIDDAAGIEALEAYERSQELSQPHRNAAEARDRLRRMRHTMETLRTAISADTPQARLCARYADAWRNAITVLNDLLQPALETRQRQHPDEIAKKLATLSADLSFQISSLEEARDPPGLQTLA